MPNHTSILSSDRFLRVRRMTPLVLILLITAAGIFQGCDDDDPVGPADPTSTPVPSATPEPTITPEPTATPDFSGAWSGVIWSTHMEDCTEGPIVFEVSQDAVNNGRATFCMSRFDRPEPFTIDVSFETLIQGNGFRAYYSEGGIFGFYYWTIEGYFESPDFIRGNWSYNSGEGGAHGAYGYGHWMADRR
ncbi:hypothetical protein JW823_03625 [bacterium]|nr:hypothetical protein [candidate division CSSED10-310 bacterium]